MPNLVPLRDRPDVCEFFAEEFRVEWPKWYGRAGPGNADEDVRAFANPTGHLPVGVVAFGDNGLPIGIAALKSTSIATHGHLSPWATAGYVVPASRREGVGASLLSALIGEARRLGFRAIYCATSRAMSLLEREGWMRIDSVFHDGETQYVYRYDVSGES